MAAGVAGGDVARRAARQVAADDGARRAEILPILPGFRRRVNCRPTACITGRKRRAAIA